MNDPLDKQQFDYSNSSDVKVGALSDTHSYINPSIAEHLSGCDLILHAGDIGSINIIKQLREICDVVVSVCGNNDSTRQWNINEHKELEKLPQVAEVNLPGGTIAVTHGDEFFSEYEIWHKKLRAHFPTAKAILYGHSHRLVCDQNEDPWVLNPGAAGKTRIQKHGVSCLRIQANSKNWNVETFRA